MCWTAFDDGVNTAVQVVEDVPRASWTGPSESIRARRGDWQGRCLKKLARDWVGGHTHGDRVQARGYFGRHAWLFEQHQGERPRPEAGAEQLRCRVRDSYANELGGIAEVNDQRIVGGPLLGFEDAAHGRRVERIRAQPVHGLGRKRDEAARAQNRCCFGDAARVGRQHPGMPASHGPNDHTPGTCPSAGRHTRLTRRVTVLPTPPVSRRFGQRHPPARGCPDA